MKTIGTIYLIFMLSISTYCQPFNFTFLKSFGKNGSQNGEFLNSLGIAVKSDFLYVVDQNNRRIQIFDKSGIYIKKIDVPALQFLAGLTDIEINDDGEIFVASIGGIGILKLNPAGEVLQEINDQNTKLVAVTGLALDTLGNLYVANFTHTNPRIVIFDSRGNYVRDFKLDYSVGDIDVDDEGNIYSSNASWEEGGVFKYDKHGTFIWKFTAYNNVDLSTALGVVYNKTSGHLFVCDADNNRVIALTKDGQAEGSFSLRHMEGNNVPVPWGIDIDEDNKMLFVTDGGFSSGVQIWSYGEITNVPDKHNKRFTVSPNPNNGIFRIISEDTPGHRKIILSIFDVSGKKIFSIENLPEGNSYDFDLSTVRDGVYLIKVETVGEPKDSHTIKMIKN